MPVLKVLQAILTFALSVGLQIIECLWSPFQEIWDEAMDFWFDVEREIRDLFQK